MIKVIELMRIVLRCRCRRRRWHCCCCCFWMIKHRLHAGCLCSKERNFCDYGDASHTWHRRVIRTHLFHK